MARRNKKREIRQKEQKDFVVPKKKPETFLTVGSAIWWEANPDKSKKYGNVEFKGKKTLTPKDRRSFLG